MNNYKNFFNALIAYLVLFFIIHILHINLFFNFHIGIILLVDIVFSVLLGNYLLSKYTSFNGFLRFVAMFCASLMATIYSIVIPIMVDRSITVDMIMQIYSSENKTISLLKLQKLSIDNAFKLRIKEQLESGIIKLKNDQIQLTEKGKIIARIFILNNKALQIRN